MVFSSIPFLFLYFPIVLAIYYIAPLRWRNAWLFAANLVFYGWGEPVYILLMLFSITINYVSGLLIEKYRANDRLARRFLIGNTALNLLLLMFFKYFDLFAETLSLIPGIEIAPLGLTLPIGISFYTFQTMSYPIDLYRGDSAVQRNYISFGTYVTLFPQLIAGPIVRYKDVDDQLSYREHSTAKFASGVTRFLVGVGKKVLIANQIGQLWDTYAVMGAGELTMMGSWLGIIAFSLQIYFDFSGYSDMAIGLGRMLGFEFLENFNYPYISRSVTEFWRRWHMSLGTWFRDYVYIPLGGNRRGMPRQIFNILVVWALTGFWHGANWTFLLWGLYYALFLIIEKLFLLKWLDRAPRAVSHIYALLIAVCGWVLFQLDTLPQVFTYYAAMFGMGGAGLSCSADLYRLLNYGPILLIAVLSCTPLGSRLYARLPERARGIVACALVLLGMILSTAYLVDATYNPFLYFRF
ncbi:MAG: MBOAT family protein [Ruminococcaceae bacterium]|nr:MBOAT family protein [Oscillospiraceae bacterium]